MFLSGHLPGPTGTGRCCPGCIYTMRQPVSAQHREMFTRLAAWPGPGSQGTVWLPCPGPAPGVEQPCLGPRF